ncbi:Retrovirus-related Pol polyprotein from transposon TNT 1-94 [Vitis vinifera]|uniref:Retrovirus-related Pol polyprotein from transposon TNT 1-94 n=1 Tax=Vitis vinifera TaxID=29760 RepID=A0A438DKB8_VITVI|nr:Retrovirus-related Pol polyprotein from transposon TNT 1-94 [Vitis vinifera]
MAEEAGKVFGIEKFDDIYFAYWRMQIEDYLYGRKLNLPLLGTKLESMKAEEWTTTDLMKALSGMYEKPFANNKEAMRMAVSNSTGKEKLKYNDIRDLIVAEEIRRRDAGETTGSGSSLNLETRGRVQCWNCGKTWHFRRQCKSPKKKNEDDSANAVTEEVYLADGSTLDVVGLGDVRISLPNGSVWLLEKFRHIPDLRRNLIFVGQLDDEGHAILFVGGTWKITKRVRVLARGKKTGTLYMTSCPRDTIVVADARHPEKLELVHTDLWGPSPVASLRGSRLDNGGEYIDGRFSEYCVAQGIRMEKTIPGTPHTATYLINRGPSVSMEFRLPEEFGAVKSKLDAKSKICFFIGYGDEKFGYRGEEDKENVNSQVDLSTPVAEWELAMKDEMNSLLENQTWELTELPVGKKVLHNKWVYRIKNEHDDSKRYKVRLVVKRFQQKEGIDYIEIFSPVVKMSTIGLVLGMVVAENLHLEQLDVKTTFFHGDLEEDLYMIKPEEFIVQGQENLVCKLRKSLYGLKQAPKQWYKKFDNFMHRIGFKRCEADHYCYVKYFDNSYIILLLYVDDMLIAGFDIEKINNLKKQLSKQFAMKDLVAAKQILGMRIIRDKANGTLKLS